jgi:peptide/nickel transport system permease protein
VSRDVLSRVLYGTRVSFLVAGLSMALSISLGTGVGLAAGLAGGAVDAALMRGVDVLLALPRVFLLLLVLTLWGRVALPALVLILGLTSWFETSRLVRASVLSTRAREYVAAARALGVRRAGVAVRHVLPNVAAPILVSATLGIGQIVLLEAGLSFLGIGVRPPAPSLGNMIADGRDFFLSAPLVAVAPGIVVTAIVLAFSALGEGLRDALAQGPA